MHSVSPWPGRRRWLRRVAAGAAATALAAAAPLRPARAQAADAAQPPQRLRLLCASPPGGAPDVLARAWALALAAASPAGVLVENRPGGGGQVAVAALRQGPGDGQTLLLAHGGLLTLAPHLYARLPYDPEADLQPLAMAAETGFVLAVGPAVPAAVNSLRGLMAWAATLPEGLAFGTPGPGTLVHVLGALLCRQAGVRAQAVAYQGGPPAIHDLLGGRLPALVLPDGLLRPHAAGGAMRLLASFGEQRSPYLPTLPTVAEAGYAGVAGREWFAFFAPGAVPAPRAAALAALLRRAAAEPGLAATLHELAMQAPEAVEPAALAARIAAERRRWRGPVGELGLRITG